MTTVSCKSRPQIKPDMLWSIDLKMSNIFSYIQAWQKEILRKISFKLRCPKSSRKKKANSTFRQRTEQRKCLSQRIGKIGSSPSTIPNEKKKLKPKSRQPITEVSVWKISTNSELIFQLPFTLLNVSKSNKILDKMKMSQFFALLDLWKYLLIGLWAINFIYGSL